MTSKENAPETSPDFDNLPRYDIVMDWGAYDGLPASEKEDFVEMAESIEQGKWFSRDGYAKVEWACIDLARYVDYNEFVKKLKKAGPAFYEGRKAEKRGYYSKFFDEQTFIGDIVAIDTSAPERQGQPMSAPRRRTVEERGGYSEEIRQPEVPKQRVFWLRKFGTFRACPGHRQGDLVVDEQLVAYLSVRRFANFINYNLLLGHKDFLRDGVVHKMQLDFVKTLLDTRNRAIAGRSPVDGSLLGLRYIGYGAFFYTYPGLKRWKKSNLFQPALFHFDFSPALKYSESACPGVNSGQPEAQAAQR